MATTSKRDNAAGSEDFGEGPSRHPERLHYKRSPPVKYPERLHYKCSPPVKIPFPAAILRKLRVVLRHSGTALDFGS